MDERTKLRSTYNKLGSFLVFVTSTFNLMYITAIEPQDAVWYGAVSGAFTHTVLAVIAEASDAEAEERPRRAAGPPAGALYPMPPQGQPMAPQMPPMAPVQQQQYVPQQQPGPVPGIDQAAKQVERELKL
jgi:hypothetical protein